MYQSFCLLKDNSINFDKLVSKLNEHNFEDVSVIDDVISIYVGEYLFKIEFVPELDEIINDIDSESVNVSEYSSYLILYGMEGDYYMDHFNDYVIICEDIQKVYDGIILDYDSESNKLSPM